MKKQKGFTLIEILLVVAIIGILAAAIFAIIGNSDNARRKSALSTARSILTYAQECYFNKSDLTAPVSSDGSGSGDIICSGSITEWPTLSEADCAYTDITASAYVVNCGEIGTITCNAVNGGCVEAE